MTRRLPQKSLGYILRFIPKNLLTVLCAVLSMAFAGLLAALISVLVGKFTDEGFVNLNPMAMYWGPVALLVIAALNGLLEVSGTYFIQKASQTILNDVRFRIYQRMILWECPVYSTITPGEVNTVFINQAANALSTAATMLTVVVKDSISIVALIGVLIWYDWKLTLITLAIAPIIIFVISRVNRKTKELTTNSQNALTEMSDCIHEDHLNHRVVKIYDGYEKAKERFLKLNRRLRRLALKTQLVSGAATPITQLTMMSGVSAVIVIALLQAQAGAMTIGQFITYLTALLMLSPSLRHISNLSAEIGRVEAAADSIYEFLSAPVETLDRGITLEKPLSGRIEVRNLSFAYRDEPVLHDVSFSVRPGEKVALVGASGAGKSTLVNLLTRFLDYETGEILFDGVEARAISKRSLRKSLSIVTQEVMLFNNSVRENILYGKPNASEKDLKEAVNLANLEPVVKILPNHLDSTVGRAGQNLSGGQRQRVSIARAMIKDAPILLLDEATSALDTESERAIEESLDSMMKHCTTIVVAHRLSTIENADQILVFDHGRIVERGKHTELLKAKGLYAELYNIQFANRVEGGVP